MKLVKGNYYVYSQKLGKVENEKFIEWTEPVKVKYLGSILNEHPDMSITHCSHHLFLGAYEIPNGCIAARTHILADFELPNVEPMTQFSKE